MHNVPKAARVWPPTANHCLKRCAAHTHCHSVCAACKTTGRREDRALCCLFLPVPVIRQCDPSAVWHHRRSVPHVGFLGCQKVGPFLSVRCTPLGIVCHPVLTHDPPADTISSQAVPPLTATDTAFWGGGGLDAVLGPWLLPGGAAIDATDCPPPARSPGPIWGAAKLYLKKARNICSVSICCAQSFVQ